MTSLSSYHWILWFNLCALFSPTIWRPSFWKDTYTPSSFLTMVLSLGDLKTSSGKNLTLTFSLFYRWFCLTSTYIRTGRNLISNYEVMSKVIEPFPLGTLLTRVPLWPSSSPGKSVTYQYKLDPYCRLSRQFDSFCLPFSLRGCFPL